MSTTTPKNNLKGLLERRPALAKRVRERAGLAEIASLLLELRHELGLSQKELSKRSGVPKTLISELENAANDGVTLRTLVKIAQGAGAKLNLDFVCCDEDSAGAVTAGLNVLAAKYQYAKVEVRESEELAA